MLKTSFCCILVLDWSAAFSHPRRQWYWWAIPLWDNQLGRQKGFPAERWCGQIPSCPHQKRGNVEGSQYWGAAQIHQGQSGFCKGTGKHTMLECSDRFNSCFLQKLLDFCSGCQVPNAFFFCLVIVMKAVLTPLFSFFPRDHTQKINQCPPNNLNVSIMSNIKCQMGSLECELDGMYIDQHLCSPATGLWLLVFVSSRYQKRAGYDKLCLFQVQL